jgi:carbon-monoxide dehydrogenase medium subunit
MRAFEYERPTALAEAIQLLERHGSAARLLAGGTDLIIGLRDGTASPSVVVDIKRIAELAPSLCEDEARLTISAAVVMTDVAANGRVRELFPALAEAAAVIGSVQIRNRATVVGNICNASPAADTAPPLLVYDAQVVAAGVGGARRIPIAAFFVRSGETTLRPDELVTAIELPLPRAPMGSLHVRRTRRRGHDLASVTLCCGIDSAGVTRIAYGSVGPKPLLVVDESGVLADRGASISAKEAVLDRMLADARPSPRSMRASPEYRLAMLRVLARRAVRGAIERLDGGAADV